MRAFISSAWPGFRGYNRAPNWPGLGLNSGPHTSQHSGRQSCRCAIESGQIFSLADLIKDLFVCVWISWILPSFGDTCIGAYPPSRLLLFPLLSSLPSRKCSHLLSIYHADKARLWLVHWSLSSIGMIPNMGFKAGLQSYLIDALLALADRSNWFKISFGDLRYFL